jgi:hypothetical protein
MSKPHPEAGRFKIIPCAHVEDDAASGFDSSGYWDLNIIDYYGIPATVAEVPTFDELLTILNNPEQGNGYVSLNQACPEYLVPYREGRS